MFAALTTFFIANLPAMQGHITLFFLWLTIGICLLAIEMGHPGLFLFLSFFIGTVCAAVSALMAYPFFMQCMLFLIGTIMAFGILRAWVHKEQRHTHRSNVYALQGAVALVTEDIKPPEYGQVKVQGQEWRAELLPHSVAVHKSESVRVIAIRGTRLIVEKI